MAPSAAELQATLRQASLRATAPRVAVLRYLTTLGSPSTHAEIADALASAGLDRATVYRNLIDLAEAGLARRADIGDHVWRFELVQRHLDDAAGSHPHFLCHQCGSVACLPEASVAIRPARGGPRALRDKGVSVQLRGLCDTCLEPNDGRSGQQPQP